MLYELHCFRIGSCIIHVFSTFAYVYYEQIIIALGMINIVFDTYVVFMGQERRRKHNLNQM